MFRTAMYLKLIYKFKTFAIKISAGFFVQNDKLKVIWNFKRPSIAKIVSKNTKNLYLTRAPRQVNRGDSSISINGSKPTGYENSK